MLYEFGLGGDLTEEDRPIIDAILTNGAHLSTFFTGVDQATIYYVPPSEDGGGTAPELLKKKFSDVNARNGHLVVMVMDIGPDGEQKTIKKYEAGALRGFDKDGLRGRPMNLNHVEKFASNEGLDYLELLLVKILTEAIPTPEQLDSQNELAGMRLDPVQQAFLGACQYGKCLCPLFFSTVGCLECAPARIETDLAVHARRFFHHPKEFHARRCIKALVSVLLQYREWSALDETIRKVIGEEKAVSLARG